MDNKYNEGFTLIELIVSIAISSIIMLMLFSVFNYNLKTFTKTSEAMNEQANLRLASYKLTDQLRNIGYIDLDSDISTPTVVTDSYIFVENNQIKIGNENGISIFADDIINDVEFSLSRNSLGKYILGVSVVGKVHSYSTEILLNNMVEASQMDITDIDVSNFNFIQFNYSKPPLTIPVKIVGEYDELLLEYPDKLTVKKNKTFTYTAGAEGGVTPYTFEIINYVSDVGVVSVDSFTNTITWDATSDIGEQMYFEVKLTDGVLNEFITAFTIEIIN
jgi:prepilin-type N-terminal cleavage/methylation domain-containing protein